VVGSAGCAAVYFEAGDACAIAADGETRVGRHCEEIVKRRRLHMFLS
jgi:hypothetical protein